jgi:histone deacetylase 1/2
VLGGGGYSKQSVARCWAINTAILVGKKVEALPKEIPKNDFYYSQYVEKTLHVENRPKGFDFNTPGHINMILQQVMANIANIPKGRDSSNTR